MPHVRMLTSWGNGSTESTIWVPPAAPGALLQALCVLWPRPQGEDIAE